MSMTTSAPPGIPQQESLMTAGLRSRPQSIQNQEGNAVSTDTGPGFSVHMERGLS